MAVETIQCPKCGSPLEIADGTRLAECTFCGSTLRITQGASGHPLGVLEGIKEDTSLMAKERALEVVRQRIARLEEERATLEGEHQAWLAEVRGPGTLRRKIENELWRSLPREERDRYAFPHLGKVLLGIAGIAGFLWVLAIWVHLAGLGAFARGALVAALAGSALCLLYSNGRQMARLQGLVNEHIAQNAYKPRIRSLTMEIKRARAREERLREEIDRQAMEL